MRAPSVKLQRRCAKVLAELERARGAGLSINIALEDVGCLVPPAPSTRELILVDGVPGNEIGGSSTAPDASIRLRAQLVRSGAVRRIALAAGGPAKRVVKLANCT